MLLSLGGMHAVHSIRLAFTALGGVPGITRAAVEMGHAELDHDGSASIDDLVVMITDALAAVGIEVLQARASKSALPMV